MPANHRMRDLIIEHADLLVEPEVPQVLRDFCAHVVSLEIALIAQNEEQPETRLVGHPGTPYSSYVRDTFAYLKSEQQLLLQEIGHGIRSIKQEHEAETKKEISETT